jgi:GntR family transcriptional regulator
MHLSKAIYKRPDVNKDRLDAQSHMPPYLQIRHQLLAEACCWPDPETRFHSEQAVATRYGVSRMTARRALSELAAEGVLRRRKGSGTFVERGRLTEALTPTMQVDRSWRALGFDTRAHVLRFESIRPSSAVLRRLRLTRGVRVLLIHRVRLVKGEPVAIDTRFIPSHVAQRASLTKADAAGDILQALWRAGPLAHADWGIESRLATADEARLLGVVAGSPVLLRIMTYFDHAGKPVAIGQTVNRADRMRYGLQLPLQSPFGERESPSLPQLELSLT